MSSALIIQAAIAKGLGAAGKVLGEPFTVYRPANPLAPLAAPLTTLPAAFNARSADFTRAPDPGKPLWYGYFDRTLTRAGDYLVGTRAGQPMTFFLGDTPAYEPSLCVECNRTLTFLDADDVTFADGLNVYAETTAPNRTTILAGWPASVLQGVKGELGRNSLPGDTRSPWWAIMLPATPGVDIKHGMLITDDDGRTMTVSSAEQSSFGWRLTAKQEVT